jgi:integrase
MTEKRLRPHQIAGLLQRVRTHNDGGSLYLIVREPGKASWVFRFRDGATVRNKGLGALPNVTLAMARRRRADVLASHGDEPHKPKTKGLPFEVLAEQYFDHHASVIGAAQLTRNRALLRLHAAPLLRRPSNRITRHEIADVLRPIWLGSSNSRGMKLRALIERILNEADDERNPALWSRVSGLLPARSKKIKRSVPVASLPWRELPEVYAELMSIDDGPGLTAARVLRFVILTGVRLKEGRGARWDEVDFSLKLWTIPASRMKIKDEDFIVPLSSAAVKLLQEIKAERSNSPFVFPGRLTGHCIGQNAVHLMLDRLDRVDDQGRAITCHGFRSTLATWTQEQVTSEGVRRFDQETIDGCLAHFVGGTTGAYQRSRHLEARRKLAKAWGAFALSAGSRS